MTDKELLQQALYALKHLCLNTSAIKGYDGHKVQPAIKAIKARLTQPEPEPVAYVSGDEHLQGIDWNLSAPELPNGTPLYTAPAKKEWVGLTDEEAKQVLFDLKVKTMGVIRIEDVVRAIEAKLKEKNT